MPYYSFDLVIGEEYKNQGGMIPPPVIFPECAHLPAHQAT
jgi:hypothetical protein